MPNVPFIVGITVLKQYEELEACIDSVKQSSILPEEIWVIDNGREWNASNDTFCVRPKTNLGVAASWNLLLRIAHPFTAIILNDDLILAPDTLSRLMEPTIPSLVTGHAWSCFRQDSAIFDLVGDYDEDYWPAYFEDADYHMRLKANGKAIVDLGSIVKSHGNHGFHPYQHFTPDEKRIFDEQVNKNKARFIDKWGGPPSDFL